MTFSTHRGRPRNPRPEHDTGTPELIFKRLFSVTAETVDTCLERELITSDQHWCAIHLRWLHTLRYGAPVARTMDPTHLGGRMLISDNAKWRAEREKELREAGEQLKNHGLLDALLQVCVYNERPKFLQARAMRLENRNSIALSRAHSAELAQLQQGLEVLRTLWCVKKT